MDKQLFINRLYEFLRNETLSIKESFFISLLILIFSFLTVLLYIGIKEISKRRIEKEGAERIQNGIMDFLLIVKDLWENNIDFSEKGIRKYFQYCEEIRQWLPDENFRDENWSMRPIKLHCCRKYYGPAVHVITEKLLGESILGESNCLDLKKIHAIHNVLGELYDCNNNSGKILIIGNERGRKNKIVKIISLSLVYTMVFMLASLFLGGLYQLAGFVDCIFISIIVCLRNKLKPLFDNVEFQPEDFLMGIPFMFVILLFILILKILGLVPSFL